MHFDFTDLRLYLNILDSGNITAGAARSHLSLAAASARIRAMESSLGIDFLERGRRGVTPTPAGKALAQHARVLLQQAERMQQDLADYAKGVKGQVRLLCNTTAITEYLPELLADFLRGNPNLDIDLQELPSTRITHALRQGAADLGIVSDAVDTERLADPPVSRRSAGADHAARSPLGGRRIRELHQHIAPRLRRPECQQRLGGIP